MTLSGKKYLNYLLRGKTEHTIHHPYEQEEFYKGKFNFCWQFEKKRPPFICENICLFREKEQKKSSITGRNVGTPKGIRIVTAVVKAVS